MGHPAKLDRAIYNSSRTAIAEKPSTTTVIVTIPGICLVASSPYRPPQDKRCRWHHHPEQPPHEPPRFRHTHRHKSPRRALNVVRLLGVVCGWNPFLAPPAECWGHACATPPVARGPDTPACYADTILTNSAPRSDPVPPRLWTPRCTAPPSSVALPPAPTFPAAYQPQRTSTHRRHPVTGGLLTAMSCQS
jgi:hypothetical protein